MKKTKVFLQDSDMQKVESVLRRVAKKEKKRAKKTKTSFIVYENGKIIDLNAVDK